MIQGQNPPEADFCRVFADIDAQRGDITLTYFEAGTLAALQLFREANLDVVILEVGLGGRLDATNIVDSHITAITSIALDHTDWLELTASISPVRKPEFSARTVWR